jgi:endogenous inhibitor of DNA gyrase (YacG/DUF329 family)
MEVKVTYNCERCGKEVTVYQSQYKKSKRHFCGRACNMAMMNEELNPTRMTEELKEKLSKSQYGSGQGKTYKKIHGRHEHRTAAEKKIGRKLKRGEVVHHLDSDRQNNEPDNLIVFNNQADHVK